jgi:hypothetical protein
MEFVSDDARKRDLACDLPSLMRWKATQLHTDPFALLLLACRKVCPELIRVYLRHRPNDLNRRGVMSQTALAYSVVMKETWSCKYKVVAALLELGAKVNTCDDMPRGSDAPTSTIEQDACLRLLILLIAYGANPFLGQGRKGYMQYLMRSLVPNNREDVIKLVTEAFHRRARLKAYLPEHETWIDAMSDLTVPAGTKAHEVMTWPVDDVQRPRLVATNSIGLTSRSRSSVSLCHSPISWGTDPATDASNRRQASESVRPALSFSTKPAMVVIMAIPDLPGYKECPEDPARFDDDLSLLLGDAELDAFEANTSDELPRFENDPNRMCTE